MAGLRAERLNEFIASNDTHCLKRQLECRCACIHADHFTTATKVLAELQLQQLSEAAHAKVTLGNHLGPFTGGCSFGGGGFGLPTG